MWAQGVGGQGVMCRVQTTGEGLVMAGHQIGVSQGARSVGSGKAQLSRELYPLVAPRETASAKFPLEVRYSGEIEMFVGIMATVVWRMVGLRAGLWERPLENAP